MTVGLPPLAAAPEDQVKAEKNDVERGVDSDSVNPHNGEEPKVENSSDMAAEQAKVREESGGVPPFPWANYFLLFVCMLTNCIIISFLFPIVGFMMIDYGLTDDRKEVGYYAGLLLSAFFVGRFFSSAAWGYVADHCGRKVVVYVSIVSSGILMLSVGLVGSFEAALLCRFLSGLLNGMLGVIKVVAGEMCHPVHAALGQTFPSVSWLTGLALGPSMAGLLAEPCSEHSFLHGYFDEESSYCTRPFLLPCVVGAALHCVALPCAWLLPETGTRTACRRRCAAWSRRYAALGDVREQAANAEAPQARAEASPTDEEGKLVGEAASTPKGGSAGAKAATRGHWLTVKTARLIGLHSANAGIHSLAEGVLSLWCMADRGTAGLGWEASTIGAAYSVAMVLSLIFQLSVGPRIISFLGPRSSVLWAFGLVAPVFLLLPQLQLLEWYLGQRLTFAIFALFVFTRQVLATTGTVSLAMLTNSAVDPDQRGRLQGTMASVQSVLQALAPTLSGTLFAWASSFSSFGAEVVFFLCATLILMNLLVARTLPYSAPARREGEQMGSG